MGTISSSTPSALNRGARRQRALNLNLTVTLVTFGASAFAKFASNISVDSSQYRHTNSGKAVRLHDVPPLIDLSFKQIADSAVDLIQIIDHEGAFAYVNPAWRARLGYSDNDLAALTMSDLLPTDIRAASVAAFQSITSGECECLPIESFVTSSAGETVGVEGNISVTQEKSGARLCVGILRESDPRRRLNDTEQQRLRNEISDREQCFRQLFDNSPIAIVMENTDRVIASANPAFHELLGYTDGELIDSSIELFCGPEAERTEPSLFQQVAGGAPIARGVREYRKKDGSLISVAVSASPIHDGSGNLTHTIGTMQDLSALRWAEREAESQLRRFRSVFDWSPIGIAVLDVDGLVVSANRALTRMVGYEAADLVGISLKTLVEPTFEMAHKGHLASLIAGEIDSFSNEITLLTRDGRAIHTESVVAPLPGEGGGDRMARST
ncbi:MAG: PAS domain S-box protein [Chloroflexi bacterium]|nr:PAS domain S-box protein [Chloroflexota bacterium]